MTQEALKLALEALEGVLDDAPKVLDASISGGLYEVVQCREAITAIKEALAQPEQEPVKYSDYEPDGVHHNKPPQEKPVAWLSTDSIGERHLCFDKPLDNDPVQPLYTTPPQRTWVGLTDEDVNGFVGQYWGDEYMKMRSMVRAIEAKLKEKNT